MITEKQLKKLIDDHLKESELFLVDLIVKPGNQISIFIDGDRRVIVEDCRKLSRFLEDNLDRESEDFDLTVSSAGADRPLKLPRQYKKNIGNALEIITKAGDKISGLLINVSDAGFEIERHAEKIAKKESDKNIMSLKFDEIKSAKEVITFKK
ncbi:MAG: ribosome assembly cofactor RimP [Bacteroidota bacterium]